MSASYNLVPSSWNYDDEYSYSSNSCGCEDNEIDNNSKKKLPDYNSSEVGVGSGAWKLIKMAAVSKSIPLLMVDEDVAVGQNVSITENPVSTLEFSDSSQFSAKPDLVKTSVEKMSCVNSQEPSIKEFNIPNSTSSKVLEKGTKFCANFNSELHFKHEENKNCARKINADEDTRLFSVNETKPDNYSCSNLSNENDQSSRTRSVSLSTDQSSVQPEKQYKKALSVDIQRQTTDDAMPPTSKFRRQSLSSPQYVLNEEPNIHSNLLANIELTSNLLMNASCSNSENGQSKPLLNECNTERSEDKPDKMAKNKRSSSITPCITDVNGQTSFKVASTNYSSDKLSRSNSSRTFSFKNLAKSAPQHTPSAGNSKTEADKKIAGTVKKNTSGNSSRSKETNSLIRSKSLSGSSSTAANTNKRKTSDSTVCLGSVMRNNSSPDVSATKNEETLLAGLFSRNLFPWKSKEDYKSTSTQKEQQREGSLSRQTLQPLISSSSSGGGRAMDYSTEVSARDGAGSHCTPTTPVPTTVASSKSNVEETNPSVPTTTNNNTSSMNYNCGVVEKFVYSASAAERGSLLSQSAVNGASSTSSSTGSINSTEVIASNSGSNWWFFSKNSQKKNKVKMSSLQQAGTAGLIMESRPMNLPAKTPEECEQHMQLYQHLIESNKRKELRELHLSQQRLEARLKQEAETAVAVAAWVEEIIPNWTAKKDTKKCRELWWKGIPSCVRGRVWKLAIGNSLNVSPHLYDILKQRSEDEISSQRTASSGGIAEGEGSQHTPGGNSAKLSDDSGCGSSCVCCSSDGSTCSHVTTTADTASSSAGRTPPSSTAEVYGGSKALYSNSSVCGGSVSSAIRGSKSSWSNSWQEVIDSATHISMDVSRTFPHLCIFQQGGPFHTPLHSVLHSYVRCRPDVGYVQGMSFIAATILLNMPESDAFIAFANLLNRPILQAFYSLHQKKMVAYYKTYTALLTILCPAMAVHLNRLEVTPDLYLLDWLLSLYTRCLPLDIASRIWDMYMKDGDEFLFRAAFGILKLYEKELLSQECTTTAAQFLTRLPTDLNDQQLFVSISKVIMPTGKKSFATLLQRHEQEARETSCV